MHLRQGTLLKGGTYRIERFINSGGFGCTYEAVHTSLDDKFAIKEFFVKDFCNRDEDTYHVTVGTHSKKALVDKLKKKFIEEAKSIRKLHHNGIVKVSDVFEENGTAYYVMDYIEGRSLKEIVEAKGKLSETEALRYIRQVSDTLKYVHSKNMLHLDVKPGNIMIDEDDTAILIDFGTSKQYDEVDGENTSTLLGKTPGYAPLEQYKQGGVSKFTPVTDIYAIGATMYKLVTGITPPEADEIYENGISFPKDLHLSENVKGTITFAMQTKRKDRPQSIAEFLKALDVKAEEVKEKPEDEGTDIEISVEPDLEPEPKPEHTPKPEPVPSPKSKNWMLYAVLAVVLGVVGYFVYDGEKKKEEKERIEAIQQAQARIYQEMLEDKNIYMSYINDGDKLLENKEYSESIEKYEQARKYEIKYSNTKYSFEFNKGADNKISIANGEKQEEQIRIAKELEAISMAEAKGELYCPSLPTSIDIKERTIRDLLYFPYGCMTSDIDSEDKAKIALMENFGSYEYINCFYVGLHKNKKFDYTYKGVSIGSVSIDFNDNRTWYCFYFDTKSEADIFYDVIKEDLIKVGIPLEVDKIYGDHSNRNHPVSVFKWVYINSASKVKKEDPVHNADVVGKYCIELGVYKRKI